MTIFLDLLIYLCQAGVLASQLLLTSLLSRRSSPKTFYTERETLMWSPKQLSASMSKMTINALSWAGHASRLQLTLMVDGVTKLTRAFLKIASQLSIRTKVSLSAASNSIFNSLGIVLARFNARAILARRVSYFDVGAREVRQLALIPNQQ